MTSKIHLILGGAAAVMALIVACGGDDGDGGDPTVEAGAGGSAGSGGGSGAGGSAGGGTGGISGAGGTPGDAGGADAQGGSGGSPSVEGGPDVTENPCGNGAVDELEQCDDNNGNSGDGCSSECTDEACDECRAEACSGPNGEEISYLGCSGLPTSEDEALCEDLLACVRRTGCASDATGDMRACYCGTIDPLPCFASPTGTNADGPCKEEVIAAAKTDLPIQIGQLYFDPNTQSPGVAGRPVGVVFYNLFCEQVRGAGDEPSGCREACAEPLGDGGGTGGHRRSGGLGRNTRERRNSRERRNGGERWERWNGTGRWRSRGCGHRPLQRMPRFQLPGSPGRQGDTVRWGRLRRI